MILARHQHAPLLTGVKVVRPCGALHLDPDCGASTHASRKPGEKDHQLALDQDSRHR